MPTNTVKGKRALAKIILRDDPYVHSMVNHITETGNTNGRTTLTWLKDTLLERGLTDVPPIKVEHWVQAKELSEHFRTVPRLIHTKGRPIINLVNHQIGALTVLKATGYVSVKTNSPLWVCECMCGKQVPMSSHELMYNLPYCNQGARGCEYGFERAKDWRACNNVPFKLGTVTPTVDNTADMILNNIIGTMSTEIH